LRWAICDGAISEGGENPCLWGGFGVVRSASPGPDGMFLSMKLASLLSARRIVPDMKSDTQWDALGELVEHLVGTGHVAGDKRDGVIEALHGREEQVSTGIGHGVAIPHAYCDQIENVLVVFGRSEEGIDFEACDNAPVHYLILLLVPKNQSQTHLQTLAAIAGLLSRCEVRERLKQAATSEEMLAIIDECEANVA